MASPCISPKIWNMSLSKIPDFPPLSSGRFELIGMIEGNFNPNYISKITPVLFIVKRSASTGDE